MGTLWRSRCITHPSSGGLKKKDNELAANARLIAAAPELLEACEEAYESVNGMEHQLPGYVMNQLRAAIAKATQP